MPGAKMGRPIMTPTPTPQGMMNASSNISNGFASMLDLTGVLAIVLVAAGIILLLAYGASSLQRYERLRAAAVAVAYSLHLAGWGLIGTFALGVVSAPFYYVATRPAAVRTEWLTYAGYVIAAYVFLVAFGAVVKRIKDGLVARHAEAAEQQPAMADGGNHR